MGWVVRLAGVAINASAEWENGAIQCKKAAGTNFSSGLTAETSLTDLTAWGGLCILAED